MMDALLDREGVPYERIPAEGLIRENLIVYEESTGQQYRFGMPGPEMSEKEWTACLDRVASMPASIRYFVASGSLPPGAPEDFYARAARLAKKMEVRFILDTSGNPLRAAVDEGVYLVKPNLRELKDLAGGEKIEEDDRQTAAARTVIDRGKSEAVVVSLGGGGVRLVTRDACRRIHSPVVPIRSKVGAGDSMVGGMVLALSRGKSLPDAVRFGIAAGAAAVMTPGTELCRKEDTERLFKNMVENPGA
jgi:6-phosphofructokinase 2